MIVYPKERRKTKDAVFEALGRADGGARGLAFVPLSFRDFPETAARTEAAFARAKRQHSGLLGRLKRLLIRGQYNWSRRYFQHHPGQVAVAWNGLTGSRMAFLQGARDAAAPVLCLELAPLPGRITVDPRGVNAEGSVPQSRAFYEAWAGADPARNGEGWRAAGAKMVARPATRRSDIAQDSGALPDTPFLFCPLQVPGDTQITLFAGWTGGIEGFIAALGRAAMHLPEGWHLRMKEHPSARRPLGDLIAPLVASGRVVLDNGSDSFAQVAASRGVVTLNSSMGMQSFFHDKPVVVLGRAFFAQEGLVTLADSAARLEAIFAAPETLSFDPVFRAQFMNWLDQVYYPHVDLPGEGADLAAFRAKLAEARALATAPDSGFGGTPVGDPSRFLRDAARDKSGT